MKIERKSPISGKVNVLDLPVTVEQLNRYQSGAGLIQEIFPELTPGQREFIQTGITEDEWEEEFAEEEDDEDELDEDDSDLDDDDEARGRDDYPWEKD
jgi:hypothetical protein